MRQRKTKHEKLTKQHKIRVIYARISAAILTIIWTILVVTIIMSLIGCAPKQTVIYKSKEVKVPVRCNITMPELPRLDDKSTDEAAVEVAKSFELHRQALYCCIYGICDIKDYNDK